jgi:hypothetical protein
VCYRKWRPRKWRHQKSRDRKWRDRKWRQSHYRKWCQSHDRKWRQSCDRKWRHFPVLFSYQSSSTKCPIVVFHSIYGFWLFLWYLLVIVCLLYYYSSKKKARENDVTSGHVTDVTSGQKAILGRIWRNFRLRMRRTYLRIVTNITSVTWLPVAPRSTSAILTELYPYTTRTSKTMDYHLNGQLVSSLLIFKWSMSHGTMKYTLKAHVC